MQCKMIWFSMLHFTLLVGKPCKRKVEGEDIAREDKKVDREV